jgi:cytochrome c oxidase subunit 3
MDEMRKDDFFGPKLGMWLFLITEILLFGGLFLIYAVYLSEHRVEFHNASVSLSTLTGAINTLILLASSLSVALAIHYLRISKQGLAKLFLGLTILFALAFLVNKYFEWGAKFAHGIYPNSPVLLQKSSGEILFFGLYFVMTGLHAFHIVVGIIILSIMFILIQKDRVNAREYIKFENSGLYWHLVDIIWIFLFPLFYLIV